MSRESENFLPNKKLKNPKSGNLRRKVIAALIVGLILSIGIFIFVEIRNERAENDPKQTTDKAMKDKGTTSSGINETDEIIESSFNVANVKEEETTTEIIESSIFKAISAQNKEEATTESSTASFEYEPTDYIDYIDYEDSTDNLNFEESTKNVTETFASESSTTLSFDSKTPNILAIGGPDYDDESSSSTSEEVSPFARHKNYKKFPHETKKRIETRIQHGEKAELFEFPWIVAMIAKNLLTNIESYYCGGSLVSEGGEGRGGAIILTAAHCVTIEKIFEISIILGEYKRTTNPDCVTIEGIEECADEIQKVFHSNFTIFPHPNYSNITGVNDIAIIKLNSPVKISKSVAPIFLPWNSPKIPEELQIIGFGKTDRWWEGSPSEVLMKAAVRLVDNKNCTKIYEATENGFQISEKNFCANDLRFYKELNKTFMIGACEGDSGSPIFDNSKIIQYGITSWGDSNECAIKNRPGVFTKVYAYLEWILDQS